MEVIDRWQAVVSVTFRLPRDPSQSVSQVSATGRLGAAALQEALNLSLAEGLAERLQAALGFEGPDDRGEVELHVVSFTPAL
jgi:hypothetical protein